MTVLGGEKRVVLWCERLYSSLCPCREEIVISFLEKEEMARANREFRGGEGPTDVLTFSMGDGMEGEILIWLGANEEGEEPDFWALDRIIHGFLHLKGIHHDTELEWEINGEEHKKLLAIALTP